jgi:hypothetical protein
MQRGASLNVCSAVGYRSDPQRGVRTFRGQGQRLDLPAARGSLQGKSLGTAASPLGHEMSSRRAGVVSSPLCASWMP